MAGPDPIGDVRTFTVRVPGPSLAANHPLAATRLAAGSCAVDDCKTGTPRRAGRSAVVVALRGHWNGMRTDMVTALDPFGVYETINGVAHWRMARFEAFVAHHRLYWPRLASGKLCTDDETFRET